MGTERPALLDSSPPGTIQTVAGPPGLGPEARAAALREDAEWFLRLPPDAQEDYRRRWREADGRVTLRAFRAKEALWRGATRGLVVFGLVDLMFGRGGLPQHGAAALLGLAVGVTWVLTNAGRFLHVLTATPLWVVLVLAFNPDVRGIVQMLFGMCLHASLCIIAAHVRDRRRSDGEEV